MKILGKVKQAVLNALRQGWSPDAVAWSVAWGFTWAVFPIYGVTTITLVLVGYIWKLNHPIMISLVYLLGPLKLLMIIPYIRLGEFLFRTDTPFSLSIPEFTLKFKDAPWQTLSDFAATFLHAIVGWAVTVPFLLGGAYVVSRMLLRTGEAARDAIAEARS